MYFYGETTFIMTWVSSSLSFQPPYDTHRRYLGLCAVPEAATYEAALPPKADTSYGSCPESVNSTDAMSTGNACYWTEPEGERTFKEGRKLCEAKGGSLAPILAWDVQEALSQKFARSGRKYFQVLSCFVCSSLSPHQSYLCCLRLILSQA